MKNIFASIDEIIKDLKNGKPIILVDDESRENEGDIIMAASSMTYDWVKFLVNDVRGLICVPLSVSIAEKLNLPLMVYNSTDPNKTGFTISVDADKDVTTGISVGDRLKTILALGNPNTQVKDLRRPGHIFPLIAKKGGVLERRGHTEGSIDLLRLAGMYEAAVICEILNEDGTMARLSKDLIPLAQKHQLKMTSIEEIVKHRTLTENFVIRKAAAKLPTELGKFEILGYENKWNGNSNVALVCGDVYDSLEPVLVRLHSACLTGDAFHSAKCDCGPQLDYAMELIQKEGKGVILYLNQEGRGIGIINKIRAYALQDKGQDTVEANESLGLPIDGREYSEAYQMLKDLGIKKVRLITNNPLKIDSLKEFGIEVTERVSVFVAERKERAFYLKVKEEKMGHLFHEN